MKKKFLVILLLVAFLIVTGCSNKNIEQNDDDIVDTTTETSNNGSKEDDIELYSDSTKMVFQRENSKLVFYYSGEKITKYEAYLDYGDAATAKLVLSRLDDDEENIKNKYTKGKYLVIEYNESEYESLTTSEVRALYSYLKEIQKNN